MLSIFCVLRVCLGGKVVLWIAYACSVTAITTHLAVEHMEREKALKDLVMQHVYRQLEESTEEMFLEMPASTTTNASGAVAGTDATKSASKSSGDFC